MNKLLVVTGCEYSGWDAVAGFLSSNPGAETLLNNSVTEFSRGLSAELVKNDSAFREAEEALAQFSSNHPLGWADDNSVHFLPFWASVDPHCQFLLVYSSPERAFAAAMKACAGDQVHADEAMANWEMSSRTMLNFFQQNRNRSLLVNVSATNEQANDLLDICSNTLDKPLTLIAQNEINSSLKVIEAKAALLLPNYDELHALYDELQGAASLPGLDIMLTGISGNRKIEFAAEGIKEFLKQQTELSQLIDRYSALDSQWAYIEQELEDTSSQLQSQSDSQKSNILESQKKQQNVEQKLELSQLQIQQLQKELEAHHRELTSCKAQLDENLRSQQDQAESKTASLGPIITAHKKELENSKQDLELNLLQINQLQEELEHYYLQCQELKTNTVATSLTSNQYRTIDHAIAKNCEITATYCEDGYEEISINLEKLTLGDGRKFETLPCKLILKAGMVGLEFRPNKNHEDITLLNWPTEMSDTYGPYLLYLPNPNEENFHQQKKLRKSMPTDDFQIISGVSRVIADCFMTGNVNSLVEIESSQFKQWRIYAARLSDEAREQDQFLTINAIKLNEEFQEEDYEHLWLQCSCLQIGQQLFEEFSFKLAAISTAKKSSDGFADSLLLEFRELSNGIPPFQAWPPEEIDEHGPKLLVSITTRGNKTRLELPEVITKSDKAFICKLAQTLPDMLTQLDHSGTMLERAWADWHGKVTTLSSGNFIYSREHRSVGRRIKALLRRVNGPGKQ